MPRWENPFFSVKKHYYVTIYLKNKYNWTAKETSKLLGCAPSQVDKSQVAFNHGYEECLSREKRYNKATVRRRREKALDALGGKCVCDGSYGCTWHNGICDLDDTEILQIDHKQGGGWKEHGYATQSRVHDDDVDDLQLLCPNCNWKKRMHRGEHRGSLKTSFIQES